MTLYSLRTLLYSLSLLAALVIATFALFHLVPTDPARTILGPNASEQEVSALRRQLGLDRPAMEQLIDYSWRLMRLDLGRSFVDGRRVSPEVARKFVLSLTLLGFCLAITVGYLGLSAMLEVVLRSQRGEFLDFLWVSSPSLFSSIFLSLLAVRFYPFYRFSGNLEVAEDFLALVPPALALALYPMAALSRILRQELRELDAAPHTMAARALGLAEYRLVVTHMIRIATIPLLSALSSLLPMLLTGAYMVEVIFSLPATGSLLAKSIMQRDWPMIEGIVLINGLLVLTVQSTIQMMQPLLDPRIATYER